MRAAKCLKKHTYLSLECNHVCDLEQLCPEQCKENLDTFILCIHLTTNSRTLLWAKSINVPCSVYALWQIDCFSLHLHLRVINFSLLFVIKVVNFTLKQLNTMSFNDADNIIVE